MSPGPGCQAASSHPCGVWVTGYWSGQDPPDSVAPAWPQPRSPLAATKPLPHELNPLPAPPSCPHTGHMIGAWDAQDLHWSGLCITQTSTDR